MQNLISSRLKEIQNKISLLEWDIPNISNSEVRSARLKELRMCREELRRLSGGISNHSSA